MSTLLNSGASSFDATAPEASPVVDRERPWPGLFPFKEEQHNFFFGRDDEIDELLHCVKRETITLLFGKPGLGKSSILQAGLFPLLRREGFLPVYIRLKFSEVAEALISQVKSAVVEAIEKGNFAEVSLPSNTDSLWEYLHRRGGNIVDHSGHVVCPVLVFDQFEEIFTLGDGSDANRQLRDHFLDSFTQLVENSVPPGLRDRLAENPKVAEQFDFACAGCRIVAGLREDYLPLLEGLRGLVPSLVLATSRMRLTEMNGEQALLAVSRPNPDLVTNQVADHIVRFVAGDTPGGAKKWESLEVPPAILSLFCRELSIKRGAAPQITDELVSGNAATIIDDFYHRCIDNKPVAVRRMIEDRLATKHGYRDNIDLKQAKEELEQAGVPGSLIDDLVDQRLLRVEEHRGTLRIELTHDVLIKPVIQSRNERLRDEASEKNRQQERAKQAQERAKRLVVAGTLTGIMLAASLVFSVYQWRRAENAKARADETAKKLATLGNNLIVDCDQTSRLFKDAAQSWQLYRTLAVNCLERAKEMHELDVNNIKVTEFLGAGHLEMAESAFGRDDVKKKITKDECKEAVKMADWLQQKPGGYKSQLVAAKTYAGAGYYLNSLKEPEGADTLDKSTQILDLAQQQQGSKNFDDGDWDAVALIYFYRATASHDSSDYNSASTFYEKAFKAEAEAYDRNPLGIYLRNEVERAIEVGDNEKDLRHTENAHDWYVKAQSLADQRISGLKDKLVDEEDQASNQSELAEAYGVLAWLDILVGSFQDALDHARTGLNQDPQQTWIKVNEAHALLFTGQLNDAIYIYRGLKDTKYRNKKLVEDIQSDFRQFCEMNQGKPEMAIIAKQLGITDQKLYSCLAANAVPK